ncbi:unnamed protein product [Mytilus edulis]|uniref:Uncharacterized protein n=1 Tax=Mytilus edulis TaxID=6550 RepID=A0A8S3SBF1_MYTED|nr:unnamed protein product [Mytilus edulis]
MDAVAEDKQKQDGEGIIKESSVQLRSDPKIKDPVIKLEVDVNNRKIEVVIWRSVQWKNEETFDPSLYLIFANPEEDKSLTLLEDVVEFARDTKLPCHITGHRVLYMGGTTAFIHRKTEKDIVKTRKLDFIVLWPNKYNDKFPKDVAEYKSHKWMPHRVKKSGQNDTYNVPWPDEITLPHRSNSTCMTSFTL